jgi:uracil-DNA glycosylase
MCSRETQQHDLAMLQQRVIACTRCRRLVKYCRKIAREKRRMYRDWEYWGKPIPSFGDPQAELLILGLAPAAHGGNRTGRIFTGDRSGDFLYRALYEAGFANQPQSRQRDDGLELRNCYITAALRCAPPANKPLPEELRTCQPYLEAELRLLKKVRAVLALGRIAFDTYLRLALRGLEPQLRSSRRAVLEDPAVCGTARLRDEREKYPPRSSFRFAHGASYELSQRLPRLFASYHPSQQNTQTGKLTPVMMRAVLEDIRRFLGEGAKALSPSTFRR